VLAGTGDPFDLFPSEVDETVPTRSNEVRGNASLLIVVDAKDRGESVAICATSSPVAHDPVRQNPEGRSGATYTVRPQRRFWQGSTWGPRKRMWLQFLPSLVARRGQAWQSLATRPQRLGPPIWSTCGIAGVALLVLSASGFSRPAAETNVPRELVLGVPLTMRTAVVESSQPPSHDRGQVYGIAPLLPVVVSPTPRRTSAVSSAVRRPGPTNPKKAKVSATQPDVSVATLFVDSAPGAASVFVDRQYVGETPLQLPNVRAGSRVVWLERAGYVRWTAGVHVPANELTRVDAKLRPETRR
jgi:hypothetical protein